MSELVGWEALASSEITHNFKVGDAVIADQNNIDAQEDVGMARVIAKVDGSPQFPYWIEYDDGCGLWSVVNGSFARSAVNKPKNVTMENLIEKARLLVKAS